MALDLVPAQPDHVPELGRICYEAFKDISERHGFVTDFVSPEFAQMVVGGLVRDEDCYSVAAMADGRLAGSNFMTTHDEVGGIGPISVDLAHQGQGIGRALMEDALNYARQNGIERVRLLQDSFNMQSLALYASLGFDTKAPCALMEPAPAEDPKSRPLMREDLAAVEELSQRIYRVTRRNEVERRLRGPFQPFIRERNGRATGYFVIGLAGHGVAETEDDMVALVLHAASQTALELRRAFCPITDGSLYRRLLAEGCRNIKVMNLMAVGPYEEPQGVWMPSVIY